MPQTELSEVLDVPGAVLDHASSLVRRRVEFDDALEELLEASGRHLPTFERARARCVAALKEGRPDPQGVRALDLLDAALDDLGTGR